MDIHHPHRRELLQHGARRQSRRARSGEVLQGDVQAVGDEGDEDVRFDPLLALMEDRPQGEVVLEFLERLLDLGEPRVVPPQRGGVFAGQVGARQIAALASPRPAQPVAPQREGEGLRGDGLAPPLAGGSRPGDTRAPPPSWRRRASATARRASTIARATRAGAARAFSAGAIPKRQRQPARAPLPRPVQPHVPDVHSHHLARQIRGFPISREQRHPRRTRSVPQHFDSNGTTPRVGYR